MKQAGARIAAAARRKEAERMFEPALNEIVRYDRIVLHRHANPDGDALGSQIGLKHILAENFPQKDIRMVGDGAGRYAFMQGFCVDAVPDDFYDGALAVILDCGSAHLVSDVRYTLADRTLRIDHHLFTGRFADVEIIDSAYESCCGLITSLAMETKLRVPPLAATALFTGMVTDSGRFRYDATTAETFERAAFLLRAGAKPDDVYAELYAQDFDMIRLRAELSLQIRFTPHRVAYLYTDAETVRAMRMDASMLSRSMVGLMSDIRGVDVWVNFTELEQGVLCELRSSRRNINPVAVKYGGGGHEKASGATVADRATAMHMLDDLDELAGGMDGTGC